MPRPVVGLFGEDSEEEVEETEMGIDRLKEILRTTATTRIRRVSLDFTRATDAVSQITFYGTARSFIGILGP